MNDELYHYGVPGMKWGVRRALKKLGNAEGHADYYKKKSKGIRDAAEEKAKLHDQKAKMYALSGNSNKASKHMSAAYKLRDRSKRETAEFDDLARHFTEKSEKLQTKVSKMSKGTLDMGSFAVTSILNKHRKKGYKDADFEWNYTENTRIEDSATRIGNDINDAIDAIRKSSRKRK